MGLRFVFGLLLRFSQNNRYMLECLPCDINSMCAGKSRPWRIHCGPNYSFRHFGADIAAFEVAGCLRISNLSMPRDCTNPRFQKPPMPAPKCRKLNFGPPLDAPGSEFHNARRIIIVRQTQERLTILILGFHSKYLFSPHKIFFVVLKFLGSLPRNFSTTKKIL